MRYRLGIVAMALTALIAPHLTATRGNFVPDWTFKGSALTGWRVLGDADWKAVDGVLVGTPKTPAGGWLVLDKALQDVQVGFDVRCGAACKTGVLLRAEKTADGG